MIGTILTMTAGVVLWAALAPARWQDTLREWAADAVTLVKAWAAEVRRKVGR